MHLKEFLHFLHFQILFPIRLRIRLLPDPRRCRPGGLQSDTNARHPTDELPVLSAPSDHNYWIRLGDLCVLHILGRESTEEPEAPCRVPNILVLFYHLLARYFAL